MVKRIAAGNASSPRREPPRIRCCLPLWKVLLMLPFLLGVNLLFILTRMNSDTFPDDPPTADHFGNLRDNFQQKQLQQSPSSLPRTPASHDRLPILTRHTTEEDYLENLKALEKALGAKSCQRRNDEHGTIVLNGDFCSETKSTNNYIVYYNSLPFDRIVCGESIPPNSHITTHTKCHSPSRLFPEIPNQTGTSMKPVHLSFGPSRTARTAQPFPCDIPCLSAAKGGIVATRYVTPIDNGEPWKISFSMEGPAYYRQLAVKEGEYKNHHYYSTTSYESEVPLPYFSWAEYDIHSPAPVDFDTAIKGASFMAKNCASKNKRENLVKELSKHFRVDSLSVCLHNAEPPPGTNLRDKIQTMRFYLFHLAFENQCYPDYITEKLWGPMQSGTIPVYFGSPNAKEHAPNNSLILVDDFPTVPALAEYLHQVANNRTLFEFHQQWRKQPLPPHFHARYDFTKVHSTCRTCRWAYSQFYGLGWNHSNQSLRELEIPRYPCVNHNGQMIKPFTEQWLSNSNITLSLSYSGPAQMTCYENENEDLVKNKLVIDDTLRRVVRQQDGVIDMFIDALHANTAILPRILQIGTTLAGAEDISTEQVETGHIRIQDSKTRLTILAWPRTKVELKKNGVGGLVEVSINETSHLPLKLRFIIEDVETLRKGADQDENFFGSLMKRDFFNPIEVFTSF